MGLNSSQIMVLNWLYNFHKKGETASYKGTIEHFGEVLKIADPMNVIKSLYDMGFISINMSNLTASLTKSGIQHYESLKRNN